VTVCLAAGGAATGQQAEQLCLLSGKVLWPEHDLSRAVVQLFRDAGFADRAVSARTLGRSGSYFTACPAGTYYVMALVDLDASGTASDGDGVAFYGVTDASDETQKPAPVQLEPGKGLSHVDLRVTSVIGADGRPKPIPTDQLGGELRALQPIGDATSYFAGPPGPDGRPLPVLQIAGRLKGRGEGQPAPAWALAATTPTFEEIESVAPVDPATGVFRLQARAEEVFVACVMDQNANFAFDAGDRVAVYGIPADGEAAAQPVLVKEDGETRIELSADGVICADGSVALADGRTVRGLTPRQLPPILTGTVTGPQVPRVIIRLFSDARFKMLVGAQAVPPNRPFAIPAPDVVGVYVVALFDADGNGQSSPGDALGFYGVTDLMAGGRPKAVVLAPGAIAEGVDVTATALMGEDGRLKALPAAQEEP
jgi:hypothetical protein